ncbi:MAG: pyruvate, phosphate dikinase/phosphoenolpyruvate synthase regulator [Desulfarculaceae bacterium]|nr:pyruvate, phosphate dikinase/phosphoenolpyruvate synthase regulator [Desulfarculaceae bacterium]MCF8072487.1 pyruvate, phosphate dikinase/phosphoenolpyruvate synthase regulator [Desulfarculaceae bacterium]MCF8102948.1 pyruvate, phosphate dikinase/phosphoenolpyruvate synthase regulator [Desulfarculaceae bacterium]MCF8117028.1 pyruvate, phosphate dikinase/phosphoenolpyruvate synthase regulator [Desulfarculaceae bacterium]
MSQRRRVKLYVLSDATGITAERMTRAALVQFSKNVKAEVVRRPHLKTPAQLKRVLAEVRQDPGLVIYSLVERRLRRALARERGRGDLEMYDLLGPLLERMSRRFRASPSLHPGLMHLAGQESMKTAAAIDFTLRHDDGAGLEDLGRADLIVLGVSRTSKTPTSLYLSCNHGLKVANVPIVRGMDPPAKLFTLKRPRKVGLIIAPEVLAAIRRSRYQGRVVPGYTDARDVARELAYSHEIYDLLKGIKIVDVTNIPIEEVAGRILRRTGLS